MFVPASAQSVLLDAAADFVDDLGAEPDHVKGVKDGDRVGQPVMNGVRVSPKRIKRGLLHAVDEPVGLGFQPGLVDAAGAAHDGVQQSCVQASGLVTVRSTMIVTARSTPIRDGRQMCSSTPSVLTFCSRAGSLVRALASTSTASQQVCQSTPSCRASADTVVSSQLSAPVAQSTARVVSTNPRRRQIV